MFKQFFSPKIFTTNNLDVSVHKMYECDKNHVFHYNVIKFKKWDFWEFWGFDRTWHTLDKFYFSYFHKWKK
jgi:hypothetical protein